MSKYIGRREGRNVADLVFVLPQTRHRTRSLFTYLCSSLALLRIRIQQHILRLLNTNVKGGGKIGIALTEIKGVGRRYANLVCKKADVDLNKR